MRKHLFIILAIGLAMCFWGCPSTREKPVAEDPCTASGGIRIDGKCYSRSKDKPNDWSDQTLQEMQRGFEERQPGGGRLQ